MDTIRNLKILAAGTAVLLAAAAGLTIPSVLSPLVAGTTGGETGRDAARLEAAYESPDPGPQLAPAGTEGEGDEAEGADRAGRTAAAAQGAGFYPFSGHQFSIRVMSAPRLASFWSSFS